MTEYGCVVADPPWPLVWTTGKTRVNGRGERHANGKRTIGYATMSVPAIADLAIPRPTAADAYLFLWAPDRFVIDGSAAAVATAWGFRPQRFLVWTKGMSLGTFPRPAHELCLVCTKGRPAYLRRDVGSAHRWKLVYEKRGRSYARKHSAKPGEFFDLVRSAVPGPYLELFARTVRPEWDGWGDEYPAAV